MKRIVLFLMYFTAISQCLPEPNDSQSERVLRRKRQNSPWAWGNAARNDNFSRKPVVTTSAPALKKPHPCDPYVPPRRQDFSAGRRVSVAKCLEYIWEMKNRQDNETHEAACIRWRRQFIGNRFVISGRDTQPGEFPHMGALGWRAVEGTWIFKCGSTLISEQFAVTAAHCTRVSRASTDIADPNPQIVRLGDKNIIDKEVNGVKPLDARISRIIPHPQYESPKKYFDIALVKLAEKVIFTKYVQPACLWTQYDTSSLGPQATVTGWGYIDVAKRTSSPELQAAVVDIIEQRRCDRLLKTAQMRHFMGLQPHQMCAGKLAGGVDTCQGDSGGPLQVKINIPITTQGSMHYLVGVTSFGVGCARANSPGVYTRVASFVAWIEDIVWGRR